MGEFEPTRPWNAKAKFTDGEAFIFGSVEMAVSATRHEIEAALRQRWSTTLPFEPPAHFELVCGIIQFRPYRESVA